jgi:transposase-like protein
MKNWTPEDRQTALSMRAAGKTFAEIGQALGRKGKNVKSFVNDLQRRDPAYVRMKPLSYDWNPSKIDEAFARIADGDSINAVAAYFGVGKTTISRMLFKQKAHGRIPDRPKMDKTKPAAQKPMLGGNFKPGYVHEPYDWKSAAKRLSAIPTGELKLIIDVDGCKWPVKRTNNAWLCCNAAKTGPGPYCKAHAKAAIKQG